MIKNSNYLLLKDDIGKPRPFTHLLPKGDHSYGLPLHRDKENAAARKTWPLTRNSDDHVGLSRPNEGGSSGQRLQDIEQVSDQGARDYSPRKTDTCLRLLYRSNTSTELRQT